jgi:Tol biopolymer transport system component
VVAFIQGSATLWKPGTPTVFLGGPFAERQPIFSPDGRWLAYESNESGALEIYVPAVSGTGEQVADLLPVSGRLHVAQRTNPRSGKSG